MSYWDSWGKRHPVTILHVKNMRFINPFLTLQMDHVQALDTFKSGPFTIQNVGISHKSPHQTHPAQLKYFQKCGTAPKLKVHGFKVGEGGEIGKGSFIYAAHFVPGQFVDVIGKRYSHFEIYRSFILCCSIGKGFQGAMKRWGFHGQPASHGVSLSHRAIGATGGRSDPGRVFKGKKMAGRMGGDRVTVKKLQILRVDTALNCLWVRGPVPGPDNSILRVIDSKCPENVKLLQSAPFPTCDTSKLPRNLDAPTISTKDPLKLGDDQK